MKKTLYAALGGLLVTAGSIFAVAGSSSSEVSAPVKANATETASLLKNPSFESYTAQDADKVTNSADGLRGWKALPEGWDLNASDATYLLVTKDCYSDNNFGKITTVPEGQYAFYVRVGWSNLTATLSQTIDNLPAGAYELTYKYRTGFANSANSDFYLTAGTAASDPISFKAGSASIFESSPWENGKFTFSNQTDGNVTITINMNFLSGGSCIMLDDFNLVRTGDPEAEKPVEKPDSPTEGIITHDFVPEAQMKDDILQMLADFTPYIKAQYQSISNKNSEGSPLGVFKGENTMGNNEQGVRHNADLSMICAFLVKYAQGKVTLPSGITWDNLKEWGANTLNYAYSTHKANKYYACNGNSYWGSSKNAGQWESSLWAMSVAYSAFFQWDTLTAAQKTAIEKMLVSECDYEINRTIPTGYAGDTKAEENGWEADILAVALGLFPENANAAKWFDTLRAFAINSYSHSSDATNTTVIDPEYDNKTVADYYKGQNLYDDWTLQNHNLFHTSYQNVVMQELGEAALGLKLFQKELYKNEKWKTNALMHNNQNVMDNVLVWLALADGELAMPNGNDWSLFLFDQITSYSTMACFLKDPNALFLENMAYKNIKARQKTTSDGSWLLRADVGARRMGVEAHRVMMTWLMHEAMSTADVTPTTWPDFVAKYGETKIFPDQNVIRGISPDRFACFSWSDGISSYTGYLTSNNPDNNKIVVPFRANNTGNFLGWYEVKGKTTNASPVVKGNYLTGKDYFAMNGELNANSSALNNRFVIYATPGNAVIYLDYVKANYDATISKEKGGLMAISTDPFMRDKRILYYEGNDAGTLSDGKALVKMASDWANIDNEIGFVALGNKGMAFGDQNNNNSIYTSKIYTLYSDDARDVKADEIADRRSVIYYTNVDAAATKALRDKVVPLTESVTEGWNAIIVPDPDGTYYLLASNFCGEKAGKVQNMTVDGYAPVLSVYTEITDSKASADLSVKANNSHVDVLKAFVKGPALTAVQDEEDPTVIYVKNNSDAEVLPEASILSDGKVVKGTFTAPTGKTVKVSVVNGQIVSEDSEMPEIQETPDEPKEDLTEGYYDVTRSFIKNANFEDDLTFGDTGSATNASGTYNPCFVNKVTALNSSYPYLLPVEGWTPASTLKTASDYCRMFSMPYSTWKYIATPQSKGNFADLVQPVEDEPERGNRLLTVLNSWSDGGNAITQTMDLPAGEYRLIFDMKYLCPNQTSNDGKTVNASDNVNTSLTGIKYGNVEDYRYPAEPGKWTKMCFDFVLEEPTQVTTSLGYSTSKGVGVANNTHLYIDHLQLLTKDVTATGSIECEIVKESPIYSIDGLLVRKAGDKTPLPRGIYIKDGKKVLINK